MNQPTKSTPPGDIEELEKMAAQIKQGEQVNRELAAQLHQKTAQAIKDTDVLLKQAMDARLALDQMCDYWNKDWAEFLATSDDRLKQIRQFRMAFDAETRQVMATWREVRQFGLDKEHDEQVAKLKDFVDVCERLQKLKTTGFLDGIVDTLIKLV